MVKLCAMLKKDVLISKRNISILFLIILLPMVFGLLSGSFKRTIPRNTPVMIVPQNSDVTQNDMDYVEGWTSLFSKPVIGIDEEEGVYKLQHEEAYLVFVVPPNVTQTMTGSGDFEILIDYSFVPVEKISEYVVHNVEIYFSTTSFKGSNIVLKKINTRKTMPEYMLPGFIMLMISLLALTILPHNMYGEYTIIRRLMIEHSFGSMVVSKILFFMILAAIQLLILRWSEVIVHVETSNIDLETLIIVLLSMLYLSSISLSISFFTKFSNAGNLINTLLLFLIILFSGLFYPVGFFPTFLQKLSMIFPTYYSMVIIRGVMLKDVDILFYSDWLIGLILFTIVTFIILGVSVKKFKEV